MVRMVSRTSESGKILKKGDSVSFTSKALSRESSNIGSPVLLTNLARRITSVPVSAGRAKKSLQEAIAATASKAATLAPTKMRRLFQVLDVSAGDGCGAGISSAAEPD